HQAPSARAASPLPGRRVAGSSVPPGEGRASRHRRRHRPPNELLPPPSRSDSTRGLSRSPAPDVPRFTSAARPLPCHTRCMRARVAFRFTWMLFAAAVALAPATAAAASPHIEQADLTGDINNIMSSYMQNAVGRAEADHADALLVVMNTPGGISTSMDEIVTSLLNCKVPVIVYVYPSGARAASAGPFGAQAADVLAMSAGTHIASWHALAASA